MHENTSIAALLLLIFRGDGWSPRRTNAEPVRLGDLIAVMLAHLVVVLALGLVMAGLGVAAAIVLKGFL